MSSPAAFGSSRCACYARRRQNMQAVLADEDCRRRRSGRRGTPLSSAGSCYSHTCFYRPSLQVCHSFKWCNYINNASSLGHLAVLRFTAVQQLSRARGHLCIRAATISSNDFRPGVALELDGSPWRVQGEHSWAPLPQRRPCTCTAVWETISPSMQACCHPLPCSC